MEEFIRFDVLFGQKTREILRSSRVLVAGLGGIGSWCAEALVRSGVGTVILVDGDVVEKSNINRQLFATYPTLGQPKAHIAVKRLLEINPRASLIPAYLFISQETVKQLIDDTQPDFIIDAIDSVGPKAYLLQHALDQNIGALCCLGAALKKDPQQLHIRPLFKTHTCPLARALRTKLRKIGAEQVIDCVFSDETPYYSGVEVSGYDGKKFLGSYMPVVATAGLLAADYCIKKLIDV
ncbi:MAG: tRNA threonylcarbamoyladenosine dehydratase [Spirochaetia bacterium]